MRRVISALDMTPQTTDSRLSIGARCSTVGKLGSGEPATRCCRRIGRDDLRVCGFEAHQFFEEAVAGCVGDRRPIEDVAAVIVRANCGAKPFRPQTAP
jgi:hypothetical protein